MQNPPLPKPWVFDSHRDPAVYTRPLVGSELVMQKTADDHNGQGDACYGLSFITSLRLDELKDRVRWALDKLRFVCPIIACSIENIASPRWVYTPSTDRRAWLEQVIVVEERGESLDPSQFMLEIVEHQRISYYVDADSATTIFKVYILTGKTSKENDEDIFEYGLYFHGPHSMLDMGPTYQALNLMCEWISGEGMDVNIEPSEEWKNLPVDPITATGGPSLKDWETNGTRILFDIFEQSARPSPCHMLERPSKPFDQSDPLIQHRITASVSQTTAIIARTRQLGISVGALFFAAHCLAQIKISPPGSTNVDFSSGTAVVSIDRYIKPPVNPKTHLISALTAIPTRFSMNEILTEKAEKARVITTAKVVKELFQKYLAEPSLPHVLAKIADSMYMQQGPAADTPLSSWDCSFQSLRDIERLLHVEHGKLTVEDVYFGNRVGQHLGVHMWTMHSKFHLQALGVMAWGEDRMKALLEEMLRIALLILDQS